VCSDVRFQNVGTIIAVESCSATQRRVKEIRMIAATGKWQHWASFVLGLWLAIGARRAINA